MFKLYFRIRTAVLTAIILVLHLETHATHIIGGEISVQSISNISHSYLIQITGFSDNASTVEFGGGEIDFGDGTLLTLDQSIQSIESIDIGGNMTKVVYKINYTYAATGNYTIRYSEQNRNVGIMNMSNSVDTPFYIEARILIDPFVGINSSPVFLSSPPEKAATWLLYTYDIQVSDPDGDSLSYAISTPQVFTGREVNDYVSLVDKKFYANFYAGNSVQNGNPSLRIDATTGVMVWDAPGFQGTYGFAITVDEWRQIAGEWFNIGSVTRDIQITVEESGIIGPEPPVLSLDQNTEKVGLNIYPNPFSNQLKVDNLYQNESAWLIDHTGRKVLQIEHSSMNIEHLHSGMYILKTSLGRSIKVIKN